MAKQDPSSFPPGEVVFLDRGNGTSVLVHLHGATILSWKVEGKEILFLSKKAVFDNKKAIRGGIPFVFPNFGPWECGPQHGFARIKRWRTENKQPPKDRSGNVCAVFTLEDDDETRSMWNAKFRVVYTLELLEKTLAMNVTVQNTDNKSFDFTCLLHTYFRTPDILKTTIGGLKDLKYVDKVLGGEATETREQITITENYDRIYQDTPSEIVVCKVADGNHNVIMKTFDFPDIVVWNPWIEKAKAMSDFSDEEYNEMICVEAGCVSKREEVQPGTQFNCSQKFTVLQASNL